MKFREIMVKFLEKTRNLKKFIKNPLDKEDMKALGRFAFDICFNGLGISLVVIVFFKTNLEWYSFLGYGFGFWFIENKLLKWLRSLRWK